MSSYSVRFSTVFPEYAKTRTDAKAIEGGSYIKDKSSNQEIKRKFRNANHVRFLNRCSTF